MKKRWSNPTQIYRVVIIFSSMLLLLLVQCGYHQSNVRTQFVKEQIQPAVAQEASTSISCDLTDGASFSTNELRSVNWTITGYIGMRYVLIHNNISEDFGQITTNTSFIVRQGIGSFTSWQYCGVQIYDGNTLINEDYVAFEVREGFWTFNTLLLLASGSVVSVAVATDVLLWRKVKRAKPGRDATFPLTRSTPAIQASAGVLTTRIPQEEAEYTEISSMRILRIWLWHSVVQDYYHKWVVREDLVNPKRPEILEREVAQVLSPPQPVVLHRTQFLNVISMQESERLVALPLNPPIVLLVLFSGRITISYLKQLQETVIELKKSFEAVTIENLPIIFDIINARLKIHQSRIYVESTEETTQVLQEGPFPEIIKDTEIFTDARGLSPPECQEITALMKKLSTRRATDMVIDEEEDLSLEISKKQD